MKIDYRTLTGHISTAYIDCDDNAGGCDHETHTGENKHTGEPITVHWNEQADEWAETDPEPCPHVFRGTTLRITPLDDAGRPTGQARVINGYFQLMIGGSDPNHVELATCHVQLEQLGHIATSAPVQLDIWNRLERYDPNRPASWVHCTLSAVDTITPIEISTDGVLFTGHATAPSWYMGITPGCPPRTRTQQKRLTRAQRKGKR